MNETLDSGLYLLPLLLVGLLALWLVLRRRQRHSRSLTRVLDRIAYERIEDLVVPDTDEGEIHIDHLLLTSHGLLIVHVKDVAGAVFGSDKMQDWTVISAERRYTFSNPQPALHDRIAAVRQVVRQVPVAGRILFPDGASFTKGTPGLVTGLDGLLEEFGEEDTAAAKVKIEAFLPHWAQIRARSGRTKSASEGRREPRV